MMYSITRTTYMRRNMLLSCLLIGFSFYCSIWAFSVLNIKVGGSPMYIIQAANGNVYVANRNYISVIKGNKVIKTIQANNTSSSTAIIANSVSSNISTIQNSQIIKTISIGSEPIGMLQAKDGKIYVVNRASSNISVIQNDQVIKTISVGSSPLFPVGNPQAILQATDGDIYVVNNHPNSVSIIHNDKVVEAIPVGNRAWYIIQASDDRIYVNSSQRIISIFLPKCPNNTRYDGANCLVSWDIPSDSSYFTAGNYLYLRSQVGCPSNTRNEGKFDNGYHCQTAVKTTTLTPKPFIYHRASDNKYGLLTSPYY